ncbi:hypothetical protein SH611_03150 [Geminicoccaceae bacterium 1502E]|nr:hypothetical protein [Geminicoccaceae bacterium 1502E]
MAMTPNDYSVSALSVEFGLDRRTVANRLAKVPPCRVQGRTKYWRLADVLTQLAPEAVRRTLPGRSQEPPPLGMEPIADIENPTHAAVLTGALLAVYASGRAAAVSAACAGCAPDRAVSIARTVGIFIWAMVTQGLADGGSVDVTDRSPNPKAYAPLPTDDELRLLASEQEATHAG